MTQILEEENGKGKINFGLVMPREILDLVDERRGDIPRSKYFQRLAERDMGIMATVTKKGGHRIENENRQR